MKKVNDEIRDRPIEKAKYAPVRLPFHIGSRLLLTRKAIVDIIVNVLHFLRENFLTLQIIPIKAEMQAPNNNAIWIALSEFKLISRL